MAAKRTARDDALSALRDLLGRGEEVVSVFLEELTGTTSLRQELEKTVKRATMARKTVDKNLEAVLTALNLPTRSDYRRLMEELHSLQGSVVNLNMKIDRLLAAQATHRPAAPPPPMAALPPRVGDAGDKPRGAAKTPARRRKSA